MGRDLNWTSTNTLFSDHRGKLVQKYIRRNPQSNHLCLEWCSGTSTAACSLPVNLSHSPSVGWSGFIMENIWEQESGEFPALCQLGSIKPRGSQLVTHHTSACIIDRLRLQGNTIARTRTKTDDTKSRPTSHTSLKRLPDGKSPPSSLTHTQWGHTLKLANVGRFTALALHLSHGLSLLPDFHDRARWGRMPV